MTRRTGRTASNGGGQVAANAAKLGSSTISVQAANGTDISNASDAINRLASMTPTNSLHGFMRASIGAGTLAAIGMSTFSAIGTASGGAPADTNYLTRRARAVCTSAASAGSGAGAQAPGGGTTGPFARNTGFAFQTIFAPVTTSANCRLFCGFAGNFGVSDFLAATDCLGIGTRGGAGSNLKIFSNDAAGNISEVDLGASFPCTANATYVAWFYCAPGAAEIFYRVRRMDTPAEALGSITSNLPTATAFTGYPQMQIQNATDASAVALAILSWDQWIPL